MALKLPVFLAADRESFWSLLPSSVSLLWHSATRKLVFLLAQVDRSDLRKPKKDKNQH